MALPSATAWQTPSGIPLWDGFFTLITFANDPDIGLWEKSTTPPGQDGGDAIDVTTFHNTTYRTKWPRSLVEITDGSFKAAYDPASWTQILAQINVRQEITVTFNDLSTEAFWGHLKSAIPDEHTDGGQPECTVTFVVDNIDDAYAESGPVLVSAAGT